MVRRGGRRPARGGRPSPSVGVEVERRLGFGVGSTSGSISSACGVEVGGLARAAARPRAAAARRPGAPARRGRPARRPRRPGGRPRRGRPRPGRGSRRRGSGPPPARTAARRRATTTAMSPIRTTTAMTMAMMTVASMAGRPTHGAALRRNLGRVPSGRGGPGAADEGRGHRRRGGRRCSTRRGAWSSSGSSTTPRSRRSRTSWRRTGEQTPLGRNDFEGYVTKRIYALFAKTRGFDELATDPLLLGVLDRVLGHYQLSGPVGIDIGPGRDAAGPAPRRRRVPDPVAAPAGGAQHDVGARRLHRGQRRHPDRARQPPHVARRTRPPTRDAIAATMPAGIVMFYVGTVWHGGGANHTDERRLGVILEYAASWLRAQENHITAVGET